MAYSETRFVGTSGWVFTKRESDGLVIGAGALAVMAIGYLVFSAQPSTPALLSSAVKVQLATGHGSGVHIGDGLILTAAHVAGDESKVDIKAADGSVRPADVLWVNKTSDVALLRTSADRLGASPLSCTPVQVGQSVHAEGSPLGVLNDSGEVVGISVSVLTASLGFGASFTGIGFVVPSYEICGLLGRS